MNLLLHRPLTLSPRFFRLSGGLRPQPAFQLLPLSLLFFVSAIGCNRLRPEPKTETVYVLAKQTFLRDRVAAVSNRVAVVQNGQRLQLLDRDRRFLKVKTETGETGWIEEHQVVNPDVVTGFNRLEKAHGQDPVVATAVLRDDGYLHLKPGRDTDRYYLLPEGDKLQMLLRASVPKAVGPQASGVASSFAGQPSMTPKKKSAARANAERERAAKGKAAEKATPAVHFAPAPPAGPSESLANPEGSAADSASTPAITPAGPPAPVPMEDWWLVRDTHGRVGWLMSGRIDVDVPDEIAGFADGQKMVAAYLLRKVADPESSFPNGLAPEYVTVLNPYQNGLPYDFNQVRVFTWNLKKHRYETAFRQRNLQGYLPVVVTAQTGDATTPSPTFQVRQGVGDGISIDPDTGAAKPASTQVVTYVLDGERVNKVGPGAPAAARETPAAAAPGRTEGRNAKKSAHTHRRKPR